MGLLSGDFQFLGSVPKPVRGACGCHRYWTSPPCICLGLAIDAESHNIIVQGEIGGSAAAAIQVFDSTGNYLSQFGGIRHHRWGAIALTRSSHHIVTIG